jgi:hypothetical protein
VDNQDKKQFKELFDATSEYYQKEPLSKMALQIYFSGLEQYSIDQIQSGIGKHITNQKNGQFYPKVPDIIRCIEGGELTTDQILAMARLKQCPLGVLCSIQIGSWDLDNQTDMFYLKQRAEECIALLPGWKQKALAGTYDDHEISIMIKHEVDPRAPLMPGLPPNNPQTVKAITQRINEVVETDKHKYLIGPANKPEDLEDCPRGREEVSKFLEKCMEDL